MSANSLFRRPVEHNIAKPVSRTTGASVSGMSANTFVLPIQLLTQSQDQESVSETKDRIHRLIKKQIAPIALSLSVTTDDADDSKKDFNHIIRLQGKVTLNEKGLSAGRSFVQRFVSLGQPDVCLSICGPDDGNHVLDPLSLSQSTQTTEISDFQMGSRIGLTDFVSHFRAQNSMTLTSNMKMRNLTATFDHDLNKFHVNFFVRDMRSHMPNVGTNFELRVRYEAVSGVMVWPLQDSSPKVLRTFFILKFPPSLYEMVITETDAREKISQSFCRSATFPAFGTECRISKADFGRCNVLVLDLPIIANALKAKKMKNTYQKALVDPWLLISNFKRFMDYMSPVPVYFACMSIHRADRLSHYSLSELTAEEELFATLYGVKCCTSVSHQMNDDLCLRNQWPAFIQSLIQKTTLHPVITEKALFDLFKLLERNVPIVSVLQTFELLYSGLVAVRYTDRTCVKGIRKMRRAVITPTHVIFLPSHPFVESRLMRICDPDHALRCHVRDTDGSILTYTMGIFASPERQKHFLAVNIRDVVLRGVTVGPNRRYQFLGSSSSQLRDHGFILYSKDGKGNDADYYRTAIGDFSRIRCVGKYIARVGQSFSQMLESVVIDSGVVPQKIADVTGGRHPQSGKPYIFTDGVGIVSPALAQKFSDRLGIESVPSAFQIRYKGCKGMVVVDTRFGPKTEFLGYRKSMDKFPCDCDTLEILKYSCPRPVYLNRPLISLLNQLGTPLVTLERLLADHLSKLINAFLNEESAIACIRSYCPHLFSMMKMTENSGLSILCEPFFRKVLDMTIRNKMRDLKKKARIQIPVDEGRIMFGVADEHQLLEYGEIFVQYTHSVTGEKIVLEGEVMVTKYPCMHPGDVRKFTAVQIPELSHIVDCIVFPTTGPRPHPNEMAGSDLDGDEYSVIWMKELFFRSENQEPMVFSDDAAEELSHEVRVTDIMDFFCEFVRTNVVGLIANAHLAIADMHSIFHPMCIDLCHKYSQALDFAKTGRNSELPAEERPKSYPDFMEKGSERSTYKSNRALGTLFRWIDLFDKAITDSCSRDSDPHSIPNPHITCDGWQEFEAIAEQDFEEYKMTCESLLTELNIESEESLLSSMPDRICKFSIGKKEDMQEMLERIVRDSFCGFRRRFEQGTKSHSERVRKAVAYYMTARVTQVSRPGVRTWYAFPWIASQELAHLMHSKNLKAKSQEVTIASLIDSILSSNGQKDCLREAHNFLIHWVKRNPLRRQRLVFDTEEELLLMANKLSSVHKDLSGRRKRPTAGDLIIATLKGLILDMMHALKNRGQIKSTLKLGIGAMMSLNTCFRTGKVEILTPVEDVPLSPISSVLRLSRLHISLSIARAESFLNLVTRYHEKVILFLQLHSDVRSLSARMVSQHNYTYWLISALGDEWSLANLSNLLIQPEFYTVTTAAIEALIRQGK